MVMFAVKNKYTLTPPAGSVFANAMKLWNLAIKNRWSWNPIQLYAYLANHFPLKLTLTQPQKR
jgi:hypothetical protein